MQGIHNIYNSFNNMWIHAINRDYEKGKKSRFMKRNLRFYFALLFVVLYSRQLGEYEFVYFQF